jgi:hypothetical protein
MGGRSCNIQIFVSRAYNWKINIKEVKHLHIQVRDVLVAQVLQYLLITIPFHEMHSTLKQ